MTGQQEHSLSWVEKKALEDNMKISQRGGEVVAAIVIGLVALFFYTHQTEETGFFTSSFGWIEAYLLMALFSLEWQDQSQDC